MNQSARASCFSRLFVVGALTVSATPQVGAETSPAPQLAGARGTLSIAPQLAAQPSPDERESSERLRAVVMGASPTLAEPALQLGIGSLGGVRTLRAGSPKTAWMDFMLASGAPAWSLRLATKAQFEVSASHRPAGDAPAVLVAEPAAPAGAYGKFDLLKLPAAPTSVTSTGLWTTTTLGETASRSVLLPSPIASMRTAPVTPSDASLLPVPLAPPTSAAGAAAGAAPVPLFESQ